MVMTKENFKKAMSLNPTLSAKLCYKAEMVRNLTDRIAGIDAFASNYIGSRQHLFDLRKQVMIEMMQIVGALAGDYKHEFNAPLFSEYVDYRNYQRLRGEAKVKTLGQMCEVLRTADECCREVWADYLQAEDDAYMTR